MRNTKNIGIVGAGPGGLTAAMLLSSRGFNVTVYEKHSEVGGRCKKIEKGAYHWDLGPTFLMYKDLLEECFTQANADIKKELDIISLDPMYKLFYKDKSFTMFSDHEKTAQEIEKHFPGSSQGFFEFLKDERKKFTKIKPVLQSHFSKLSSYFSKDLIKALPYLGLGTPFFHHLKKYFHDEDLALAFSFQSKYLGMSAWECPSLFSMIPHLEHEYGIHHVQGGLNQINKAMERVALRHGAKFYTNTAVKEILVDNGRAHSILLENGDTHKFDHLILNADFAFSIKNLINEKNLKKYTEKKTESMKYSCSTFMLYLGLNQPVSLPFHSIFFAQNYKKNVREIFEEGRLSNDISFYIRNASVLDPSCAPKNHSALYILVPVPNLKILQTPNHTWDLYKETIYSNLESRLNIPNFRESIQEEIIYTPNDWENIMNVQYGATFNLAHSWDQLAMFRPHNAFNDIKSLYLVGGATHPGSGLPTIYESGRIATKLILESEGSSYEP